LQRHYPPSTVLRTSPPPRSSARPIPRGCPVAGNVPAPPRLPLLSLSSVVACRCHYPGGTAKCLCRSASFAAAAFPVNWGRSASASFISRPAQHSLTFRPATSPDRQSDPLHQRLRRLRRLHRLSNCYRLERPLPDRTFTC